MKTNCHQTNKPNSRHGKENKLKQLAKELATNPDAPIAWSVLGIVIIIGAYVIWASIKGKTTHYLVAQILLSSVSLIFMVFAIFMIAKQHSIVEEPLKHYTITKNGNKLHFESHSAYLKTADIPITRTDDDYYLVQYEDVEAVVWKKDLAHSEVAK